MDAAAAANLLEPEPDAEWSLGARHRQAWAMGAHPRLGVASVLAELSYDLIGRVAEEHALLMRAQMLILQKHGIKSDDAKVYLRHKLKHQLFIMVPALQTLTSLQELYLGDNQLTDVSPLATLTSLQELDLSDNPLTDVSPLATLTSLQTLVLEDNQLTDVSPLATLTSLRWLWLGNNQLTDVSPLATLTSLHTLGLNNNQLTDVSPLATLTSLQYLYLCDNQLTDASPGVKALKDRGIDVSL